MSNVRSAYTAGSALSPDAVRFFHALGINLKQIYGSTEVTGGATIHRDDDIKFASVGAPLPDVEVRTSAEDEILIAGPTVLVGYYKDPEGTDATCWWRQTAVAGSAPAMPAILMRTVTSSIWTGSRIC